MYASGVLILPGVGIDDGMGLPMSQLSVMKARYV